MKPVPVDLVNLTIENFDGYSRTKVDKMMSKLEKSQPHVFDFIRTLSEIDDWTDGEFATTMMLTLMAHTMLSRSLSEDQKVPTVSAEMLRDALGINRISLETIAQEGEDITIGLLNMVQKYHQSPILSFILMAIIDDSDQEESHIEEDMSLYIFIYIKSIIDCLDKA